MSLRGAQRRSNLLPMERQYFVYILTNHHNAVFYTGVASNLSRRIAEHRRGTVPGFSRRYNLDKLAFYDACRTLPPRSRARIRSRPSPKSASASSTRNSIPDGWLSTSPRAGTHPTSVTTSPPGVEVGLAFSRCRYRGELLPPGNRRRATRRRSVRPGGRCPLDPIRWRGSGLPSRRHLEAPTHCTDLHPPMSLRGAKRRSNLHPADRSCYGSTVTAPPSPPRCHCEERSDEAISCPWSANISSTS